MHTDKLPLEDLAIGMMVSRAWKWKKKIIMSVLLQEPPNSGFGRHGLESYQGCPIYE